MTAADAAALRYAAGGELVLPLAGKLPTTAHGVLDATDDVAAVRAWWARTPAANVGLRPAPGEFVLDVDPRHGGDDALAALLGELGVRLPETRTAATGGGGLHYWLRADPAALDAVRAQLCPGVDVKTHSGYVVAPPSIHPDTGLPYRWVVDGPVAAAPSWLLDRLARPVRTPAPRRPPHSTAGGLRPGDDYEARVSWAEVLEPAGWEWVRSVDGVDYWRRPGKRGRGHSASTNYGDAGTFWCWSPDGAPFEPERSYTRFGAYAALHHGGDHGAAAAELRRLGYGGDDPPFEGAEYVPAPAVRAQERRPQDREHRADAGGGWEAYAPTGGGPMRGDAGPPPAARGRRRIELAAASGIAVRAVRWLWRERLPLGSLTLLGGREGIGKSTAAYTVAAAVTRGRLDGAWADTPRAVMVAATEDSWAHTIVPRLIAAGADLDLVYRLDVVTEDGAPAGLTLPVDVPAVEAAAVDHDVALILLDPLLSRLGTLDTHKDAEVRRALEPLTALADRCGATVLGLIHVNKGGGADPLTSLMGSRAFSAVARSVLYVVADRDDAGLRLLGLAKSNLGPSDLPTLRFRIEGRQVADTEEGPVVSGALVWDGEDPRSLSAMLEDAAEHSDVRSATDEAGEWLLAYLGDAGGTALSSDVRRLGQQSGHGQDALKRARTRLGVTASNTRTTPRRTLWSLPEDRASQRGASRAGGVSLTALTAPTAPTAHEESLPARRSVSSTRGETTYGTTTPSYPVVGAVSAVGAVRDGPRAHEGLHRLAGEAGEIGAGRPCPVHPGVTELHGGVCLRCEFATAAETDEVRDDGGGQGGS